MSASITTLFFFLSQLTVTHPNFLYIDRQVLISILVSNREFKTLNGLPRPFGSMRQLLISSTPDPRCWPNKKLLKSYSSATNQMIISKIKPPAARKWQSPVVHLGPLMSAASEGRDRSLPQRKMGFPKVTLLRIKKLVQFTLPFSLMIECFSLLLLLNTSNIIISPRAQVEILSGLPLYYEATKT